ncbi:thioredoxin fold domain-containing protein [Sulfurimonas sp.]|jgi:thioredoxin-related protein|uniref:thioredoxin family protein n=1 Tax=Sulfurimonas sp. TaxID=2022749 RepID=UPI0025D9E014|nr:thioredoxin fold domain-containing protein [Sulfurimonas sp.]MBT5935364.1 thioredoxin fold domain-containing protein [Sulfurimonas sp.]
MFKKTTLLISLLFLTFLDAQEINIDEAVKLSKKTNKPILLYFHKIGCSYCNSMQAFTLEDDFVIEFIQNNYKIFHINVSRNDQITYKGKTSGGLCLAKDVGYNFYPSVLFLDDKADIEYASLGYKSENEFLVILEYVKKGFYKTMSLDFYKEKINYQSNLEDEINDNRNYNR